VCFGMAHKITIDDAIGSLQNLALSLRIAGRTSHVSEDVVFNYDLLGNAIFD
jgi:hypothetical protein